MSTEAGETNLDSQGQSLFEDYFGVRPLAFLDAVASTTRDAVCDSIDAVEAAMKADKPDDESVRAHCDELEQEILARADHYLDIFELYAFKNIFVLPGAATSPPMASDAASQAAQRSVESLDQLPAVRELLERKMALQYMRHTMLRELDELQRSSKDMADSIEAAGPVASEESGALLQHLLARANQLQASLESLAPVAAQAPPAPTPRDSLRGLYERHSSDLRTARLPDVLRLLTRS